MNVRERTKGKGREEYRDLAFYMQAPKVTIQI